MVNIGKYHTIHGSSGLGVFATTKINKTFKVSNLQQLVVEMEVLNLPSGWANMRKHGQQMSKKYFKHMVVVSFNDNDSYHYVLTEWRMILHNNFPRSLCQLHAVCACLK